MIRTANLTNVTNGLKSFIEHGWSGEAAIVLNDGEFDTMPTTTAMGIRGAEIVTKCDTNDAEWLLSLSDEDLLDYIEERRMLNEFLEKTGRG